MVNAGNNDENTVKIFWDGNRTWVPLMGLMGCLLVSTLAGASGPSGDKANYMVDVCVESVLSKTDPMLFSRLRECHVPQQ